MRFRVLAIVVLASVSCGKKGPPLAPFVRVPAAVTAVTPQRIGGDVYVSFTVPSANADGQKPATIAGLEIYAVTSERPPENEKQREMAALIATVPVRPILPAPLVPANTSPPPPMPLPPGVDQAAVVAVREVLSDQARVPIVLPVDDKAVTPQVPTPERFDDQPAVSLPLLAPPPTQLPRRHYFVFGVSPRGRRSTPSTPVSVPLEPGSAAPGAPVVTHTATELMMTWAPSPDARTATFLLPPTVKPVTGANATPSNTTPPAPPPLPPLPATSRGFDTQATGYHVYDVTPLSPAPADDPFAITPPTPITPQPTVNTEYVIPAVTFGVERCFQVRPVDQVFGVVVIGPASPTTCITPADTFPPAAPASLAAIAGPGVISLIWDPNRENDLAGYIVLRGDAPGDTLQAITAQPIATTTYRDETVKPGGRYVYAVMAVDRAVPPNVSPQSNRAEETARQ